MTRINTARTVLDATTLLTLGNLALSVLQDPAVHTAWRDAANDCSGAVTSIVTAVNTVAKAVNSVARAGSETAGSWRRHGGTAPLSSSAD